MNKKIIIFLILICFIGLGIFLFLINKKNPSKETSATETAKVSQNDTTIISTDPNPLDNMIITENQVIKITFSDALENIGELKYSIEPKVDLKMQLSPDRKTLTITPIKSFSLGNTYTLFIKPDSKFDGGKRLNGDKVYHFKTVTFRGF